VSSVGVPLAAPYDTPASFKSVHLGGHVTLRLAEGEGGAIDSGARIWDAGRALADALSRRVSVGERVLELGAGTGIVGLSAAAMGADVTLTDRQELLPLLRKNIAVNALRERADALALEWGCDETIEALGRNVEFDLIVGSDLLYAPHSFSELLETIVRLSTPAHTEVLLAYPTRYTEDIFLEQASDYFDEIECIEVEPTIYVSRLKRRALS